MKQSVKLLLIGLVLGILAMFLISTVNAVPPNNQACLGKDFSGYAQAGSGFGSFISGLAQSTDGVGNEVQLHLSGQIPDALIQNSCND